MFLDNEKVDIKDLIGSLQKEGQYGGLKKKLVNNAVFTLTKTRSVLSALDRFIPVHDWSKLDPK